MLDIKPVRTLLGKTFVIPPFQRGYRWGEENVRLFLDDLFEYRKRGKGFYCLQPIVVVPDRQDENRYVVVDGQQRLTTIHLLLNYIYSRDREDMENLNINMEFEARPGQKQFMSIESLSAANSEAYLKNIDYFYLKKAWDTIGNWYRSNNRSTERSHTWEMLTLDEGKQVSVIWQEIEEDDAVSSFRRLNYGKIPLDTNEIVKALLFQKDYHPNHDRMTAIVARRAVEWDKCERDLADPWLGGMIGLDLNNGKMGVVLDFVCDELNAELEDKFKRRSADNNERDLFNYHVIDSYLQKAGHDPESRARQAEVVWQKIQDEYNRIANWYRNREWYHLIGLYSLLTNKTGSKLLKELNELSSDPLTDKKMFAETLRKKIGEKIKVPAKNKKGNLYPKEQQGLNCPDLCYSGDYEDRLIPILTAFNVWIVQTDADGVRRFPFHLYRAHKKMTLEHIHPQSLADDLDMESYRSWVAARKKHMEKAPVPEDEDEKKKYDQLKSAINKLAKLLKARERPDDEIRAAVKKIERRLNSYAEITEGEIHSIKNLALLDMETNSSIGNRDLDAKREILLQRMEKGCWIPPATEDVFAKKYSAGTVTNMALWQPEDREKYMEKISRAYKYYTEK